jgi:hypothetical protein
MKYEREISSGSERRRVNISGSTAGAMSDDCRGQNTQNLLMGLLHLILHSNPNHTIGGVVWYGSAQMLTPGSRTPLRVCLIRCSDQIRKLQAILPASARPIGGDFLGMQR